MVKIVNFVYAASLYGALMFALYGNNSLIGDSGEGRRRDISLAPAREAETSGVGTFKYGEERGSLTRSASAVTATSG